MKSDRQSTSSKGYHSKELSGFSSGAHKSEKPVNSLMKSWRPRVSKA